MAVLSLKVTYFLFIGFYCGLFKLPLPLLLLLFYYITSAVLPIFRRLWLRLRSVLKNQITE